MNGASVQSSRRSFLKYVGAGAAAAATAHVLGPLSAYSAAEATNGAWLTADGLPAWTPVGYPIPLPGDPGEPKGDAERLKSYTVADDLLLPGEFKSQIIAAWGDRFGPQDKQIAFGYAADYTGIVKVPDTADEYWLIVNHEYISARPWLQGWSMVHEQAHGPCPVSGDGKIGKLQLLNGSLDLLDPDVLAVIDPAALKAIRTVCTAAMEDLGSSVIRIRIKPDASVEAIKEAEAIRISGASAQNLTGGMTFTGPAAGMLGEPRGTFSNCSGATTPWGTFLTCEENIQEQVPDAVAPDGSTPAGASKTFGGLPEPTNLRVPIEFTGLGTGLEKPLDGRQYGWVVEIDPARKTMKKHTALGRFRHENVALRVEPGRRLAAYMGDDRRGGHVWKFVSREIVAGRASHPDNAKLLEDGTLYVARFERNYTGRWIPVEAGTRVARPEVERTAMGNMHLPKRPKGGAAVVGTASYAEREMSAGDWLGGIEAYTGLKLGEITLGDLVRQDKPLKPPLTAEQQTGVLRMDAFLMANAAGGTPCSRPEDIEVHAADKSVYIAFSDNTGSADGSPDKRIFPDSAKKNSRQYGAIYRVVEDNDDPAAETFTWGKFVSSGEAAEGGAGFACADNLAFDAAGNLWVVCDLTTLAHNAPIGRVDKTAPGERDFMGLFGNNAMFMIPVSGPRAGLPHCFAIGPMESELTGPTFTEDGRTLILSVQHPGELWGTREGDKSETRKMKVAARDGKVFDQERVVPLGSNFAAKDGDGKKVPRPCVVAIRLA